MGIPDRDYMHDRHRERPFSADTERASMGTFLMALVFVASLFFLYKFADWYHRKQVSEAAAIELAAPTMIETSTAPRASAASAVESSARTADAPAAESPITGHVVTKCTLDGKTSYGDGPCARGAITTLVTTRPDSNLIAPTRVQPVTLPPAAALQPAPVVAQANGVSPLAAKKAECEMLDAHIKNLDAMSRQPQGAPTMDWINAERKTARDRQFRIQC
jgi:cbb3-type cytochrome oxidase subunit 3